MKFADILNNQKLWSVVYDNEAEDILSQTLSAWMYVITEKCTRFQLKSIPAEYGSKITKVCC